MLPETGIFGTRHHWSGIVQSGSAMFNVWDIQKRRNERCGLILYSAPPLQELWLYIETRIHILFEWLKS